MTGYVAGRVLALGVLLFGLLCITFAISHVIPGDPARLAAGPDASEAMVQTLRAQYGLDRSLGTQFVVYTRGLLRGDFGLSLRSRNTVADDLARFFPNSFELVTLSLLLAVAVGVPLGMLSAVYRDTWIDHGSRVMSVSGVAVPAFWLPLGGRLNLTTELPP
ncbi:MAG: peptide ABC transporter, partial [Candidatus Rokuibacteriota bacterium]